MIERLPIPGFILTREERGNAKAESSKALATYHSARAQHPEPAGVNLYEKIPTLTGSGCLGGPGARLSGGTKLPRVA